MLKPIKVARVQHHSGMVQGLLLAVVPTVTAPVEEGPGWPVQPRTSPKLWLGVQAMMTESYCYLHDCITPAGRLHTALQLFNNYSSVSTTVCKTLIHHDPSPKNNDALCLLTGAASAYPHLHS